MVRFRRRRERSLGDATTEPLLSVDRLSVRFGGLVAVSDLDLDVDAGTITSLIGPNGAGKTTAFNCISGFQRPSRGSVRIEGRRIERAFRPSTLGGILGIGLLAGLLLAAAAIDIDGLFLAVVKRPAAEGEPLSLGSLTDRLRSYFRQELAVDRLGLSWRVVTPDGREVVAVARTRDEAVALRDDLQAAIAARVGGPERPIPSPAEPAVTGVALDRLATAKARIRRRGWIALTTGWLAGSLGAYVVWRRSRRSAEVVAEAGVARTFQNIRLFPEMTVLANVQVGCDWGRRDRAADRSAEQLLAMVGLEGFADQFAETLSYGDRRRLEIARALATAPRLLLLDEPAAGMNPTETVALATLIERIRDAGVTVLLIEHHMRIVMRISDRVAVLDHGVKIAEGTPDDIRRDERVIAAYLGEAD